MSRSGRSVRRSDAGFTLVELLVAVAALGIIMVPLSAGIFVGFRAITSTANRLNSSTDAQLLSVYLPPDVQSASAATTTASGCTGLVGTVALQLRNADNSFNVVYSSSGGSATLPWKVTRYVCTTGAATKPIVVARNVKPAVTSPVTVAVTGSPMTKVTMTLIEASSTTDSSNYTFTVVGRRRDT